MEYQANASLSSLPAVVESDYSVSAADDDTSMGSGHECILSIEQILFRHLDDDEFSSYISYAYHDRSWLLNVPSSALFNVLEYLFGESIDLVNHEEDIKVLFYAHPGLYVTLPHDHWMFDYDLANQRPFPARAIGNCAFPASAATVEAGSTDASLSGVPDGRLVPLRLFQSSQSSCSEPNRSNPPAQDLSPDSID